MIRRCQIQPHCRARSNGTPPDRSSFEAFTQRRDVPVNFPEAEWHQEFAEIPRFGGSIAHDLEIRRRSP